MKAMYKNGSILFYRTITHDENSSVVELIKQLPDLVEFLDIWHANKHIIEYLKSEFIKYNNFLNILFIFLLTTF